MRLLNSKIGFFLYLILQNRFVQQFISEDEKKKINEINNKHNNVRLDYNSQDYQLGKNWSSFNTEDDYRGWLKFIPVFKKKVKVLEIGPGSGYYSRFICENNNVEHYSFCELNLNFREYLSKQLTKLKLSKNSFSFYSFKENFLDDKTQLKYDYIFFISSFHHIPNREEYFKKCFNSLNLNGKIIFIEPTHYLFRIINILKKFLTIYKNYDKEQIVQNCSTHAFCTVAEFNSIAKNFEKECSIEDNYIVRSKKINKVLDHVKVNIIRKFISKYFSAEIVTVIEKK